MNDICTVGNLSEVISATTGSAGGPYTADYNNASVFYLNAAPTSATNYTLNIINLPSLTNSTRSYVITVINNTGIKNAYCSSLTLSTTGTTGSTYTMVFNGGSSAISISSSTATVQQFAVMYYSGTLFVLSNVSGFLA